MVSLYNVLKRFKMNNKKKIRFVVFIEVNTNKSIKSATDAIRSGIYRGLDSPPHHIAQPNDVSVGILDDTENELIDEFW